jgi:Cof subfamily protein (haloacid dehalogenase superfamily)
MAEKIALVVSDIDGTLITSNHELTESTRATARRLEERGIMLSLASSRPARSIRPLAEALGTRTPFASFNGAIIMTADGQIVAASVIQPDTTARIKAIADGLGLGLWAYDENEWAVSVVDSFVEREQHTSGFDPLIDDYAERIAGPLNKLTVVGKPEMVAIAEQQVLTELAGIVTASRSKPRFLDVTTCGVDKGSAVPRLSELLGVPLQVTAVIGDGPNDIVMFKQAGLSIAMGQAVDDVIAAASYITSSNDNEGWSRGIEKYVLGA